MLTLCPGCGALFPPVDERTHRYLGASAGCWRLAFSLKDTVGADVELLAQSRVPAATTATSLPPSAQTVDGQPVDELVGDAYGVQHHGEDSQQAIQSVAIHLLTLHGILDRQVKVASALWVRRRTLRTRGVFHKLEPPPLGTALTIRHFFPGGGVTTPSTRSEYVYSVYNTWIALHRSTVESWYERFVIPD